MRMVLTDNVTHDTGALDCRLIRDNAQLMHTVHHATMHRLEPVTSIRQGTSHDNTHGIAEIAILHVLFNKGLKLRSRDHFF